AELPVHVGLLDEVRPDVYRFSHLSFQEFLAARYIADSDRWDDLLDHYAEPWWREVVLLCAGYLSQSRCQLLPGALDRARSAAGSTSYRPAARGGYHCRARTL
ncbi:hypothetical protein HC891_15905, partial [Candidatus Gracilibacteria bacterium]|nr:hypothetical protein [Candidatus Gracilibacteria bacterium]